VSGQNSVLYIFELSSGTRASPVVLMGNGEYDPNEPPTHWNIKYTVHHKSLFIIISYLIQYVVDMHGHHQVLKLQNV